MYRFPGDQRGPRFPFLFVMETLMSSLKVFRTESEALPQIAAILARGVLALRQRMKRPEVLPIPSKAEISELPRLSRRGGPRRVIRRPVSESGRNRLEVSAHSRPTVHAG